MKAYLKWQEAGKYLTGGTISVIIVLVAIFNLSGMSYTIPPDITCGEDCYSEVHVNSTYWSIQVEHSDDKPVIYKKQSTSRTLWVNLDKIGEFIPTNPEVFVEVMIRTTSKYAIINHPEYGYLRPLKDGDYLVKRQNKNNPNGWKIYIHGEKEAFQTVKWGLELESLMMQDITFDPEWIGEEDKIVYDYSSVTECEKGTCTVKIGHSFAYDVDNKWKPIEDAKSLKNSTIMCEVNSDGIHYAECKDWNTTTVTLNLSSKYIELSAKERTLGTPIKVWIPNSSKEISEMTGDFKNDYYVISEYVKLFKSKDDMFVEEIPLPLNGIVEIGENSTIIILNETNTGNLGDSYSMSWDPANPEGSVTYVQVQEFTSGNSRAFIKWNISIVPSGSIITNANLSLYMELPPGDGIGSRDHVVYNTTTTSWEEATLTWNNQPINDTLQDNVSTGTDVKWLYWNVTDGTARAYSNTTNKNLSLLLKDDQASGTNYYTRYTSKEGATAANRPQLVITYDEAAPPTGNDTVDLYLNGTVNTNKSYTYPSYINATGTTNGTDVYLYRDGVEVASGAKPQSEIIRLGNGTHAYKVNVSTNGTGVTYYALVIDGALAGSLTGNNVTYPNAVEISPSEPNVGDADVNYTLWRNDTLVSSFIGSVPTADTSVLAAGWYVYIFNSSGGANWTSNASMATRGIQVNKTAPTIHLYLNGTEDNKTYTYPQATTAFGWVETPSSATGNLYRNGTDVGTTGMVYQETQLEYSSNGTWYFPIILMFDGDYGTYSGCNTGGGACFLYINYTNPGTVSALWQSKIYNDTYLLNASVPSSCLSLNKLQLRVVTAVGQGVNTTCWNNSEWIYVTNHSPQVQIYEEAVFWNRESYEDIQLGVGVYNYSFNFTNENYTLASVWYLATVNQGATDVTLYINGSTTNQTFAGDVIINLTAVSNVSGSTVNMHLNDTDYGEDFQTGTTPQVNYTNTSNLDFSVYNFSAHVVGTANYTASAVEFLILSVRNISLSVVFADSNTDEFRINATSNNGTFAPFNQTSSMGIFNITNNGNTTINVTLELNESLPACMPNWLWSNDSTITTGYANITGTTAGVLNHSVEAGTVFSVWCQIDYVSCTVGTNADRDLIFKGVYVSG